MKKLPLSLILIYAIFTHCGKEDSEPGTTALPATTAQPKSSAVDTTTAKTSTHVRIAHRTAAVSALSDKTVRERDYNRRLTLIYTMSAHNEEIERLRRSIGMSNE